LNLVYEFDKPMGTAARVEASRARRASLFVYAAVEKLSHAIE
jgi:hypothetical protein